MILIFVGAMFGVYYWLTSALGVSLVTTIVMLIMGFLFAAVAGFLVSVIGSSSNPISGLTLSTLLIAAGLLVLLGMKGRPGVIAVLGVAAVVCCVAGVAGDMIQDWKVGHNLGATPWRMEVSGLIGVVAASLVLVPIILLLHKSGGGIGSEGLSAPQAGLMHSTATGIIGGTMPWAYIVIGMLFAVALILVGVPSPMLIAVGMYLPFTTTAAIFAGGVIRWIADQLAQKRFGQSKSVLEQVENRGLLVASGLVAGEAMVGIVLAGIVASNTKIFCGAGDWAKHLQGKLHCVAQTPSWFHAKALGVVVILGLAVYMISLSLKGVKAAPEPTAPTDGDGPPSGEVAPPPAPPSADAPPAA
jgi:putative OPT family oligopeptide transporter